MPTLLDLFRSDLVGTPVMVAGRMMSRAAEVDRLLSGFAALRDCLHGAECHLEGDVLRHSCLVVGYASEDILAMDPTEGEALLAAALAHDICKPETRREQGNKVTFYGHAEAGGKRVPAFAAACGYGADQAQTVEWLVTQHMNAHLLLSWGPKKKEPIFRHPAWPLLVLLQRADALATWMSQDGSVTAPVLMEKLGEDRVTTLRQLDEEAIGNQVKAWITTRLTAIGKTPGKYFGTVNTAARASSIALSTDQGEVNQWVDEYVANNPE